MVCREALDFGWMAFEQAEIRQPYWRLNRRIRVGRFPCRRVWVISSDAPASRVIGKGYRLTALPMLLAQELGVTVDKIVVDFAPAGTAFVNNLLGTQVTGGSTSIREGWTKLRVAGAQARDMLISAACAQWGQSTVSCRVENGQVVSPRGDRLSFGTVAEAAGKLPVPKEVQLRKSAEFRVICKPQNRLDTPRKLVAQRSTALMYVSMACSMAHWLNRRC